MPAVGGAIAGGRGGAPAALCPPARAGQRQSRCPLGAQRPGMEELLLLPPPVLPLCLRSAA